MPKRTDIHSVLIIGAGPIVIGQACEFDYSGVQAVKALKEEGYRVILVNSNPATIMTDPELADATYVEPITPEFVEKIIARERPNCPGVFALLPTMGGQTALNTALELERNGALRRHNVEMIGARADVNAPPQAKAALSVLGASKTTLDRLARHQASLVQMAGLSGWSEGKETPKDALQIVVDEAKGKCIVIAHTAHHSALETVELTQHAEAVGADFAIYMNPYYPPVNDDMIYDWFSFVAARVNIGRSRPSEVLNVQATISTLHAQIEQLQGQLKVARESFALKPFSATMSMPPESSSSLDLVLKSP